MFSIIFLSQCHKPHNVNVTIKFQRRHSITVDIEPVSTVFRFFPTQCRDSVSFFVSGHRIKLPSDITAAMERRLQDTTTISAPIKRTAWHGPRTYQIRYAAMRSGILKYFSVFVSSRWVTDRLKRRCCKWKSWRAARPVDDHDEFKISIGIGFVLIRSASSLLWMLLVVYVKVFDQETQEMLKSFVLSVLLRANANHFKGYRIM